MSPSSTAIETPTSRLAHHVGMVFEDPDTQITSTSVAEEVAFALENLKVPTAEIARRVGAALSMVGLAGLEDKHPANLSGGQKQRLSIASALALSSDIIVLDEPTSQLDPVATAEVFAILRRLNRENGLTVVVASHASEELAEIADRILLVADGRIVAEGSPETVFSQTAMLGLAQGAAARHRALARGAGGFVGRGDLPETFPVTLAGASQAYVDRPLPPPPAARVAARDRHRRSGDGARRHRPDACLSRRDASAARRRPHGSAGRVPGASPGATAAASRRWCGISCGCSTRRRARCGSEAATSPSSRSAIWRSASATSRRTRTSRSSATRSPRRWGSPSP